MLRRSAPLLFALAGLSCSAQTFEYQPCAAASECRTAFGIGSACVEGLCAAASVPARCTPSDGFTLPASEDDWIVLGTIFNRSTDHLARERAVQLAVEAVNDSQGVEGRMVGALYCTNEPDFEGDGLDEDEATDQLASFLASEFGVMALVGPSSSARTQAAFFATEPAGTLLISPAATSPALTALDGLSHSDEEPGLLWRTAAPDDGQSLRMVQDMLSRGVSDVAVIHATDAYGEGLALTFAETFQQAGGNVSPLPFSNDTELATQTVSAVEDIAAEEVVFISSSVDEVVAFLNAASALSAYTDGGVDIFLSESARTDALLSDATVAIQALSTIRGTAPLLPEGVVYDAFRSQYQVRFGEDPARFVFSAHAYDAGWLAIYGATWALVQEDGATGLNMARGLRQLSSGTSFDIRPTNYNAIRANFADGTSVDIRGASGELDYDPVTGETTAPIGVWGIEPSGPSFFDYP